MVPISREKIDLPEGVEAKVTDNNIEVSGPKGKVLRTFNDPEMKIEVEGHTILAEIGSVRRKKRAMMGTFRSHILNMVKGVTEGFIYKLRVVYSHFPISIKADGKRVIINNFLGERSPRVAYIAGDVTVEISGEDLLVKGINRDNVGQTAINIESATSVKYKDKKTFQDGCYICERS